MSRRPTGRPRSPFPAALLAVLVTVLAVVAAAPGAAAAGRHLPAATSTAWVRAAHLVPGVGTMTIRLVPFAGSALSDVPSGSVPEAVAEGQTRVLEPAVGYGGIGDYRQVPAGVYAVTIRPVGSGTSGPPVLTGTFEARPGEAVTLAALGGTKKDPRVEIITDSPASPASGTARVRLLPALPQVSAISVRADGGPVIARDAAYGQPTAYRTVPAGTWDLTLTTTGGTADITPLDSTVDVGGGGAYTVFVLGDGDGGVVLKPVSDAMGASATPVDGVQTGFGGVASRPGDTAVRAGLTVGAIGTSILLLLTVVGRRRRPRPGPAW
ncbi:DUF4397 domain-containing protein [Arthrobacter sp. NEB 688]|uniref:DUF4397 domain-containing protein n=1 Tax=Arthrobacter sp. NEB 688 TaxID=904039 RepID=UPI001563FFC3|nr:DUF4397 domain-containing protein [Arthrobacter sp. NEB 688]QKE83578.1 DUF4397 domain-containing protein [Arthrobacter sp. NEB 688]